MSSEATPKGNAGNAAELIKAVKAVSIPGLSVQEIGGKMSIRGNLERILGLQAEELKDAGRVKFAANRLTLSEQVQRLPEKQRDALINFINAQVHKRVEVLATETGKSLQQAVAPAQKRSSTDTPLPAPLVIRNPNIDGRSKKKKPTGGGRNKLYAGVAAGALAVAGVLGWGLSRNGEEKPESDGPAKNLVAKADPPSGSVKKLEPKIVEPSVETPVVDPPKIDPPKEDEPKIEPPMKDPDPVPPMPKETPVMPPIVPVTPPMPMDPPMTEVIPVKSFKERVVEAQNKVTEAGFLLPALPEEFYERKGIYAPNFVQPQGWNTQTMCISMRCEKYTEGSDVHVILPQPITVGNQFFLGAKVSVEFGGKVLPEDQYRVTPYWRNSNGTKKGGDIDPENPHGTYYASVQISGDVLAKNGVRSDNKGSLVVKLNAVVMHPQFDGKTSTVKTRSEATLRSATGLREPAAPYALPDTAGISPRVKLYLDQAQRGVNAFERLQSGFAAGVALPYDAKTQDLLKPLTSLRGDCGVKVLIMQELAQLQPGLGKENQMFFAEGYSRAYMANPSFGGRHAVGYVVSHAKGTPGSFIADPRSANPYIGPQVAGKDDAWIITGLGLKTFRGKKNGTNGGSQFNDLSKVKFGSACASLPGVGPDGRSIPAYHTAEEIQALASVYQEDTRRIAVAASGAK